MGIDGTLTRKQFLGTMLLAASAPSALAKEPSVADETELAITLEDLASADKVNGIALSDKHRKVALPGVNSRVRDYETVRKLKMPNEVEPNLVFTPIGRQSKPGKKVTVKTTPTRGFGMVSDEDLAFLSAVELGHAVRSKKLSPVDLTELYLKRLETHGKTLNCVITLTPELARKQAKQAEQEIAAGHYRGPLHGLPYGIKDLFAVKGYRTTWGAEAFRDQVIDHDAAVVEKLTAAGAICLAKLSCGALAYNDVWWGGRTNNPWNPKEGSSGSSAGSACATAAGLAAFTIGTETLGSIISPANRCRVSGLRPTYGRVSRYGGMVLTWTMDKVGPICRTAEDCAVVLSAILGHDPRDMATVDRPFNYRPNLDLKKLKIGVLAKGKGDALDSEWAKGLRAMGANLSIAKFTSPPEGIWALLAAEAAAFFDQLTRSEGIDKIGSLWPPEFLASRYMPAVEYINAHRARALMAQTFEKEWGDYDLLVTDNFWDEVFTICNGTGHPQVIIPWGVDSKNEPQSISVIGRLYDEGRAASLANMIQRTRDFHLKRPDASQW